MVYAVVSLMALVLAIVLGFVKKMNVGVVSMGLAFFVGLFGHVEANTIIGGFPSKLFVTLLGTMFFFCLLQENGTLSLLSKKIVHLVGNRTYLIPVIIYLTSYILSAAGPGAISVQSVMILFAVSLAVEIKASVLLLGSMAILGAVGGTTSPIALTGIIVSELTAPQGIEGAVLPVFYGVSVVNFICAIILYVIFKGYKSEADLHSNDQELPRFTKNQLISIVAIVALLITVVGLRWDVGLVSFALSLILMLLGAVDEQAALKSVPWSVLILICGVSLLMAVAKKLGGITLLANTLALFMNHVTASPIIGLTAGIMSWFSSANGVVFPTLIPTVEHLVSQIGGDVSPIELIIAIVGGATVAGISPLSTGGSLILAAYSQEAGVKAKEQQKMFIHLFAISFGMVLVVVAASLIGFFKFF